MVVVVIKTLLVGNNISDLCVASLGKMGYNVVKMPCFSKLQPGVSAHIDMLMFYDGESLITHSDYYKINMELFDSLNIPVLTTDEEISDNYPSDIIFNAVLTAEGKLFSKTDKTSILIKERAKECIEVKQGYTACSTCKVTDNAFITTDKGLYREYTQNGIDCLLVNSDGIDLPNYNCGFIGGASVVLNDCVCFFGDIEAHMDYKKIADFVEKYGKRAVSLSDEKLTDIGGCIVVCN